MSELPWAPWAGCASGAIGSLLLATKSRASDWGFVVYLVSNVAWISVGVLTGIHALCVQGLIYSVIALYGVWRWLLAPRNSDQVSRECWLTTRSGRVLCVAIEVPADADQVALESAAFRAITQRAVFRFEPRSSPAGHQTTPRRIRAR
jgi:Nicotinamide mononucleotide transporter